MLIKIESFPDGSSVTTPSQTLHVCLATTKHESDEGNNNNDDDGSNNAAGVICSVGRKVGDITFPKDKGVSRLHSTIRIINQHGDDGGGGFGHKPRNDEESKACEESEYGMCVVFESDGKAGSYIAVPKKVIPVNDDDGDDSETDDGGGDDDDEETDDEGISQPLSMNNNKQSQASSTAAASQQNINLPPLSPAVQDFWKEKPVELKKVDAGSKEVLPFSTKDENSRTILIQCGLKGSTIRLTLIPIYVAFSGVHKKESKEIKLRIFPKIGALSVPDELPDKSTTCLVIAERTPVAKQLIAWCYDVPMVSKSFLEAMEERSNPIDPLPNPKDFEVTKSKDDTDCWDNKSDQNLLSEYTLLSLDSNELESLAVAAGAKCVALYGDNIQNDSAESVAKQCIDRGDLCFALLGRSKLSHKLHDMGVPQVTKKVLAQAVINQTKVLQDDKRNPIVRESRDKEDDQAEKKPQPNENEAEETEMIDVDADDDNNDDDINTGTQPMSQGRKVPSMNLQKQETESAPAPTPETRKAKRKADREDVLVEEPPTSKNKEEDEEEEEEARGGRSTKRRRKGETESPETSRSVSTTMNAKRDKKDASLETLKEEEEETPREQGHEEDSKMDDQDEVRAEKHLSLSSDEPSRKKKEATKVSTTTKALFGASDNSGWFTVAPKDDDIRKECRDRALRKHGDDDDFFAPATTEVVATLVINRERPPTTNNKATSTKQKYTGPNFKKFRKNLVIKAVDREIYSVSAVLPKETEQQRKLDDDARELEEEQRRADELFRGDGLGMAKKRRRRI